MRTPPANPTEQVARVIGAVNHAVAGPVQSLGNVVFVLRRRLAALPEAQRSLDQLQAQVDRVMTRLDGLMALVDAVRPPQRSEQPLAGLLAKAMDGLEGGDRVRVTAPLERVTVRVDGAQVLQAWRALLDNALRFSPLQSPVVVTLGIEGRGLRLTVENTAAEGAWPGLVETAFDPFFTTRPQALGLGLPLARAVAVGHGGTVELRVADGHTRVEFIVLDAVGDSHG